jgi:hypothetical protein
MCIGFRSDISAFFWMMPRNVASLGFEEIKSFLEHRELNIAALQYATYVLYNELLI